jgi:hypothetical protein
MRCKPIGSVGPIAAGESCGVKVRFRLITAVQFSSCSLQTRHSSQPSDDLTGCNDFVQEGAAKRVIEVLGTNPSQLWAN